MTAAKRIIYYATFRSNDMNEYSTFWHHPYYQTFSEGTVAEIRESLEQAAREGADELEVRGGEPLVNENLMEILRSVRTHFNITLRTNGLIESIRMHEWKDLADQILLTLYHPEPEIHDRILGVEGSEIFYETAKTLAEQKFPAEILFVVTRETITHLPEAFELAGGVGLPLRIEPYYLSAELGAFEKNSIDSIRYYGKRPNVLFSSQIDKQLGEDERKIDRRFCTAGNSTTTIMPDGSVLSPCVYSEGEKGGAGKLLACNRCSDWSYLLSSRKGSHFWPRKEANIR